NRSRVETEGVVGFFVNTVALRVKLSGEEDVDEMLSRVREAVVGGFAHQEVPFDRVVEAIGPERRGGQNPLFQVAFSYQERGTYGGGAYDGGVEGVEEGGRVYASVSKFDVTLTLREQGEGLRGWLEYSTDLYEG